jgi:hypothetical protein
MKRRPELSPITRVQTTGTSGQPDATQAAPACARDLRP